MALKLLLPTAEQIWLEMQQNKSSKVYLNTKN